MLKYITNPKYRFFHKKIKDVTKSMWEIDFKISKSRAMREESRQARDRATEAVQRLKAAPVTEDTTKQLEQAEAEVKGYEAQMQLIDDQINGTQGEDAITGLMDHLSGLADLKAMYKEYSSKI